jgi:hypothetical protein
LSCCYENANDPNGAQPQGGGSPPAFLFVHRAGHSDYLELLQQQIEATDNGEI